MDDLNSIRRGWEGEWIMELIWYLGGPCLGAFLFQLLIGCRTACRPLRYVPLYAFLLTLLFGLMALRADAGFFVGLNAAAALLWWLIGACILTGYGLAHFVCRVQQNNQ